MGNNKASVKWASDDDAGDLLAGILDETASEASQEQERIEAEIQARKDQELKVKAAEDERKRAEAEARISAEMDRLEQVEKRRTQKIEALKIEDLKASGQWKPPEEEIVPKPAPAPVNQAPVPVPVAAAQPASYAAPPEVAPQASKKPVLILGGVLTLAVAAALAVVFLAGGGYELDSTPYTKAVYTPKDSQIMIGEMAFAPIPKAEPVVEEAAPAERRPMTRTAPSRAAAASASPTKQAPAPTKAAPKKKLDLDLDFDPFGGGF